MNIETITAGWAKPVLDQMGLAQQPQNEENLTSLRAELEQSQVLDRIRGAQDSGGGQTNSVSIAQPNPADEIDAWRRWFAPRTQRNRLQKRKATKHREAEHCHLRTVLSSEGLDLKG